MITGTVRLDLSRDSHEADRKALTAMYGVPEGSRVILVVGSRDFANPQTVRHLSEYLPTLHLDVHGSPAAVAAWVRDLRRDGGGEWA